MDRRFALRALLAAGLAATAGPASAAEWPARLITLVVPLAAGGSTDITARLLADKLGPELGQTVIVENRTGAGGNIGAAVVAKAAPDGYTLLLTTSTAAANVTLYKNQSFDLQRDFVPVSQLTKIPNVLMVNKAVPARTVPEFIAYARGKNGGIDYGSAGNGTSQHLSGALFNAMAGTGMVHVPYKGGAPANVDLMGGQIQAVFAPLVEVLPYIESGALRALAVTTPERSPRLPDLPTVGETLPGFDVTLWNGVFAPAGTPPAVVERLAGAIRKVMLEPAVRRLLTEQGTTAVGSTPAEFKTFLGPEIAKWADLVRLSGAAVD